MTDGLDRTSSEMERLLKQRPRTCPVCSYVAQAMDRRVDAFLYELVNDPPMRERIRDAGGFCRRHSALIARHADALGTAIVMKDVLVNALREIEAGRCDRPPAFAALHERMRSVFPRGKGSASCLLCDAERDIGAVTVDSFLSGVANGGLTGALDGSSGLCLPHFETAFERCKDEQAWTRVLAMERRALRGLVDELEELTRKYDYRFSGEAIGDEADAWHRGLQMTAGEALPSIDEGRTGRQPSEGE